MSQSGWGHTTQRSVVGELCDLFMSRQKAKRAKKFADQLPDMVNLLVGALREGYGLLYSCKVVHQEMPEPISTEFARVLKETSLDLAWKKRWNIW